MLDTAWLVSRQTLISLLRMGDEYNWEDEIGSCDHILPERMTSYLCNEFKPAPMAQIIAITPV